MLRSFKTEINPTPAQKAKINRTIGTCRYVYNLYLDCNKARHAKGEMFMTGSAFSVWLNNEYIPNNPDKVYQLADYGMEIVERVSIQMNATSQDLFYLKTKQMKMGHLLNY